MNAIQAHRGPDGEGVWSSQDRRCVLGHRRLAILDLSGAAAQPMSRRGHVIVFNGEVYNYRELRERLKQLGHGFSTDSDTEVVLAAYEAWGVDCLEQFNGMFAFALWDTGRQWLFCARDRFGEKPFLYSLSKERIAFASEAKALAVLGDVPLEVHDATLAAYVFGGSTRVDANPETLLVGMRQLMPGHAMTVEVAADGVHVRREWCYWTVDVTDRHPPGQDALEESSRELLALLADSVSLRLRSDVPVGSCLSGGLDSSAVVCLIRRVAPEARLRTFTGRFPGDPADEGHYAKLVAECVGAEQREVAPSPERFIREASRLYWHADFPIGGMSQFAQWCVFHLAREGQVTVLLDGQGSDELLGGYGGDIVRAYLAQLWRAREWVRWLRERRAWAEEAPETFSWPRLALAQAALRPVRRVFRRVGNRGQVTAGTLVSHEWGREAARDLGQGAQVPGTAMTSLSSMLYDLSFRSMLSSLLRYGDRLSMAHSREVRLPFCDHRIAELAFRLSPELLVGGGVVKRVLRAAIRGLVPDAIVTRPKQGFVPPQTAWLVGPLAPLLRELAGRAGGALGDRLDRRAIQELACADEATRKREAGGLWHSLNLLCWEEFALGAMRDLPKVSALAG